MVGTFDVQSHDGMSWKDLLRNTRVIQEYLLAKYFTDEERGPMQQLIAKYPFRINAYYASLIKERGDPIWRQAIPDVQELENPPHAISDPLQETGEVYHPTKNLIHRYPQKALILASNTCPTFCRHCFRNYFVGNSEFADANSLDHILDAIAYIGVFNSVVDGTPESFDRLREAIRGKQKISLSEAYVDRHKENAAKSLELGAYRIRDVLLSGGDPLSLSDEKLDAILGELSKTPGVDVIRIGTRFPVLLPRRFDDSLMRVLGKYADRPLYVNTHFNHHWEITPESSAACRKLTEAGIVVRNQTVFLRGVNDDVRTAKELWERLLNIRVAPYYVYQTMMAEGTNHLRVPVWKGLHIMSQMRGHMTGFGIPTHIISAPGGRGKVPLPEGLVSYDIAKGIAEIRNYEGNVYQFHDPIDYPKPDRRTLHELHQHPVLRHILR